MDSVKRYHPVGPVGARMREETLGGYVRIDDYMAVCTKLAGARALLDRRSQELEGAYDQIAEKLETLAKAWGNDSEFARNKRDSYLLAAEFARSFKSK